MFCLARADSGGIVLQGTEFDLDELLLDTVHAIGWLASPKEFKSKSVRWTSRLHTVIRICFIVSLLISLRMR